MTPSEVQEMTAGQINKAAANYRALLEKRSREFDTEAVQKALGRRELADEQFEVFRRHIEMFAGLLVRRVPVNRALTPQQALDATGRKQYTEQSVVDSMPRGQGDETATFFFQLRPEECTRPGYVSCDDLEKAFARRDFVPEFPDDLAAINAADPSFADEHPNGTQWKDSKDRWCFAGFGRWRDGERDLRVDRGGHGWRGDWWFAGRRK
jgi:hypothetical protein